MHLRHVLGFPKATILSYLYVFVYKMGFILRKVRVSVMKIQDCVWICVMAYSVVLFKQIIFGSVTLVTKMSQSARRISAYTPGPSLLKHT